MAAHVAMNTGALSCGRMNGGQDAEIPSDTNGQRSPNVGEQLRLTYAEIAARLSISGDNARVLVRRRGWFRIVPNRKGQPTVVVVSEADLAAEQRARTTGQQTPPTSADNGGLGLGELVALLDRTQTRLVDAERRADRAEQRAQDAQERLSKMEQAEEQRRGQGRWARLKAAWRGEGRSEAPRSGRD
jgi:hypothetical protein